MDWRSSGLLPNNRPLPFILRLKQMLHKHIILAAQHVLNLGWTNWCNKSPPEKNNVTKLPSLTDNHPHTVSPESRPFLYRPPPIHDTNTWCLCSAACKRHRRRFDDTSPVSLPCESDRPSHSMRLLWHRFRRLFSICFSRFRRYHLFHHRRSAARIHRQLASLWGPLLVS